MCPVSKVHVLVLHFVLIVTARWVVSVPLYLYRTPFVSMWQNWLRAVSIFNPHGHGHGRRVDSRDESGTVLEEGKGAKCWAANLGGGWDKKHWLGTRPRRIDPGCIVAEVGMGKKWWGMVNCFKWSSIMHQQLCAEQLSIVYHKAAPNICSLSSCIMPAWLTLRIAHLLLSLLNTALSKTVATVITYPLQSGQVLIRLRKNEVKDLQQADLSSMEIEEYNGMADCLYQQYTRGGFSSLFQGMSSKLVQTVGQASFIFVTYEQMLALVAKVIESR